MTPTSTLDGILTGLIDGTLIVLIVLLAAYVAKRRQHAPVTHPVAEDLPGRATPIGELPVSD